MVAALPPLMNFIGLVTRKRLILCADREKLLKIKNLNQNCISSRTQKQRADLIESSSCSKAICPHFVAQVKFRKHHLSAIRYENHTLFSFYNYTFDFFFVRNLFRYISALVGLHFVMILEELACFGVPGIQMGS